MMNVSGKVYLLIEYDGRPFSGWQFQPGVLTVQGEIERALESYLRKLVRGLGITLEFPIRVTGSGRTDAGVHARGQVASFLWPDEIPLDVHALRTALNGITHHGIAVRCIEPANSNFDARHSPHVKLYSYRLLLRSENAALEDGFVWRVQENFNIQEVIKASQVFTGEHDFSAFRAADCGATTTRRTILLSTVTREEGDILTYSILGKGFLKQMVRNIVGALVAVGRGKLCSAEISNMLLTGKRHEVVSTAPPEGLTLEWVRYF